MVLIKLARMYMNKAWHQAWCGACQSIILIPCSGLYLGSETPKSLYICNKGNTIIYFLLESPEPAPAKKAKQAAAKDVEDSDEGTFISLTFLSMSLGNDDAIR